jgi:hypothetical protein
MELDYTISWSEARRILGLMFSGLPIRSSARANPKINFRNGGVTAAMGSHLDI